MNTNKMPESAELPSRLPTNSVVLDVRTDMEHDEKSLACPHLHVPLDKLDELTVKNNPQLINETVYVVCRAGKRAQIAAERLVAAGCRDVRVVLGGLEACEALGHAVKKGGNPSCYGLSLERQVRIAVGVLVFIGSACALYTDIRFAFLPLFLGAGLVFAGVTNRCGMALILTKAPWNKNN
jgi:rhodanese-related sulfurtransferase